MKRAKKRAVPVPGQRTRAVGYVRVSTDMQAEDGASLEAQGAAIRAYCALYNVDLVPVPLRGAEGPPAPFAMDAGFSASTLERPALQAALAMLAAGEVDAIVVAKLDRLTRSIYDLADLFRNHFTHAGALLSVGDQFDTRNAGGRLVMNILASVAQWEREAIGERTSAVMKHLFAQGRYVGGRTRYGRRREGALIVDHPDEMQVIAAARALRARGLSLRAVGARLADQGMRPRAGGTWAAEQVSRMVA